MSDLLIRLYDRPWSLAVERDVMHGHLIVRKPIGPEVTRIVSWVETHFNGKWASETSVALSSHPMGCYIALIENELVGFCCFNATALGYIGPIGVDERHRSLGIGRTLLNATCYEMKTAGYGYAVVGWVEHAVIPFYQRVTSAVEIPDSEPGLYRGMIEQAG